MLSEFLLMGLWLSDLVLLGARRLRPAVAALVFQGVALALLPLTLSGHVSDAGIAAALVCGGTLLVKAVLVPSLLAKAARSVRSDDETAPYVSHQSATLIGLGVIAFALLISTRLPAGTTGSPNLLLPTAITSAVIGFILLLTRRSAIHQVIGYLAFENGVFVFGQLVPGELPLIVELGMLLDVLAGVAIMSIVIFHIRRTFRHIDTHALFELRD